MKSYFVETWGCQMNVLDSQRLEGVLQARGLHPAVRAEEADVVLLNTCAVREKSVQKVVSRLGELRRLREASGLPRVVGLCGCVAEQDGEALLRRLPVVGFLLGPGHVEDLGGALDAWEDGQRARQTGFDSPSFDPDLIARPDSARQYVTIIHGCNQRCTYCVVPRTRGAEVSRTLAEVVSEVKGLVRRGAREITLLGQTVNAYRCPQTGADLAQLLEAVCGVDGLWNVQFITSHPRYFNPRLVRAVGGLPCLGTYLHMPFQAGSDQVLRRMARGYTTNRYRDVVARLRDVRPELTFSTDVIVGFPGESDADFEETLRLVEEVRFGQLYGFVFSARGGTAAAELGERVSRDVAKARIEQLFAVQAEIQLDLNRTLVGREVDVLVDGPARRGGGRWQGRGRDNRVVNFDGWEGLAVSQLVRVKIAGASAHALLGRRVGGSGEGETEVHPAPPST